MLKNLRDKVALSGVTVLMIGIALLIFTFVSAYGFLAQGLTILASQDLVQTFGEALAPLIATCIRIMYLGVMGWIGSLITIRGVTIIAHAPQTVPSVVQKETAEARIQPQVQTQPQQQPKPLPPRVEKPKVEKPKEEKPKEEKPKEVAKPPEPEIVVIPPEQIAQPQSQPSPPEKNETAPQSGNT